MRLLLLFAVTLIAACASLPSGEPLDADGFQVVGRVAVRYGKEAASGRVSWRHSARADDLLISNPVGQGIAEIARRQGVYTLVTSEGARHTATDPEQLTEEVLGWRLPLAGLPDWLRGRPLPGVPMQTRYEGQRLAELEQLGWRISYQAYDDTRGLPTRVRLVRDDLDIRLAIEDWQTAQ